MREKCGRHHWRGKKKDAVAYYLHSYDCDECTSIVVFLCARHVRKAEREGIKGIKYNGGLWPFVT